MSSLHSGQALSLSATGHPLASATTAQPRLTAYGMLPVASNPEQHNNSALRDVQRTARSPQQPR